MSNTAPAAGRLYDRPPGTLNYEEGPLAATTHCLQTIRASRIRIGRLTTAGLPLSGADNMYVSDTVISINFSTETEPGDEFTQKNGNGDICVTAKSPDHIKRVNLSMNLCNLDAEILEMTTGGTLITDGAQTIGLNSPRPSDTAPTVSLEAWSLAWANGAQAVGSLSEALYWHWVFPKTQWVMGSTTIENGVAVIPITGTSEESAALGNGIFNDLPTVTTWGPFAFFLDSVIPASACGYQSAPAQ